MFGRTRWGGEKGAASEEAVLQVGKGGVRGKAIMNTKVKSKKAGSPCAKEKPSKSCSSVAAGRKSGSNSWKRKRVARPPGEPGEGTT